MRRPPDTPHPEEDERKAATFATDEPILLPPGCTPAVPPSAAEADTPAPVPEAPALHLDVAAYGRLVCKQCDGTAVTDVPMHPMAHTVVLDDRQTYKWSHRDRFGDSLALRARRLAHRGPTLVSPTPFVCMP